MIFTPSEEKKKPAIRKTSLTQWEPAAIIAVACGRFSGLTKDELFQDINSDESLREICLNTDRSMK